MSKIESLNFTNVLPMPGYHLSSKRGILAKDGYEITADVPNQRYLIVWVHPQSGKRSATYFAHYGNVAGGVLADEAPAKKAPAPAPVPADVVNMTAKPVDVKPAKPARKPASKALVAPAGTL